MKLSKFLNRETVTYGIFGILTTILSIATYYLFMQIYDGWLITSAAVTLSNTLSTVIAVLFAYITNKIWVFRSGSFKPGVVIKEFLKFITGRLFTYILETAALIILVSHMGLYQQYCKVFTTVCVILMNYVISKKAVFKN